MLRIIKHTFIAAILILISCEKRNNSQPEADFIVSPQYGDIETSFIFDASPSQDEETENWRLKVRWDVYSDGIWDSEYSVDKKFAYKFREEGEHIVSLEVLDSYGGKSQYSQSVVVSPVIIDSFFIDPRDQEYYRTVKLYGKLWMSENLRYGTELGRNSFPRDNEVVEMYFFKDDSSQTQKYGAFYTWNEATNYRKNTTQGICPDGWHIPTLYDINTIKTLTAKLWDAHRFYSTGGIFHLDFPSSGRYYYPGADWDRQELSGNFWISTDLPFPRFSSWITYGKDSLKYTSDYNTVAWKHGWKSEWGEYTYEKIALPVRCVKD